MSGVSNADLLAGLKLHGDPDTVGDVELGAWQGKGGVQQVGGAAHLNQLQEEVQRG